jgi:hypothetical protein
VCSVQCSVCNLLLLLLLPLVNVFLLLQRRGVLPRPGLTLHRVTFNEVTQKAVTEALQQPRQVGE